MSKIKTNKQQQQKITKQNKETETMQGGFKWHWALSFKTAGQVF